MFLDSYKFILFISIICYCHAVMKRYFNHDFQVKEAEKIRVDDDVEEIDGENENASATSVAR